MDPEDVTTALLPEIKDALFVVASDCGIAEMSNTLELLSRCFQSLAICRLLESGEIGKFRDNLARSAFARRYFLKQSEQAGRHDDRRLALGRTEAFFDALAAGHGLLAKELATLSVDTWHEGWEYQDDFCYFLFLHRIVIDPASRGQPAVRDVLNTLATVLEGEEPPRLAVLRAIDAHDHSAFNDALRALMEQYDQQAQARKDLLLEPDLEAFLHWPRTFISIEGLALIAVAKAMQMEVDEDIPLCPVIARLSMSSVAAEDPFEGIEARRFTS